MPLSCNLGTLTSWKPLGHSSPVTGLIYLTLRPSGKECCSRYSNVVPPEMQRPGSCFRNSRVCCHVRRCQWLCRYCLALNSRPARLQKNVPSSAGDRSLITSRHAKRGIYVLLLVTVSHELWSRRRHGCSSLTPRCDLPHTQNFIIHCHHGYSRVVLVTTLLWSSNLLSSSSNLYNYRLSPIIYHQLSHTVIM